MEFRKILADCDPGAQRLAMGARELIMDTLPGAVEVVWEIQRTAGYGIGPRKMSEQFVWLLPYKGHVTVSFPAGSILEDPTGLLKGVGARIRNVKLLSTSDLTSQALRDLVAAGVDELRSRS